MKKDLDYLLDHKLEILELIYLELRKKINIRNLASRVVWVIIIFIAFIIVNEMANWYSIESPSTIAAGLGAIGTLLLAWVTIRTLAQNEELVKHQEAQFKPIVRKSTNYSVDDEYDNDIVVPLENVGNGKALNLKLTPKLSIKDEWPYQTINKYSSNNSNDLPTITPTSKPLYDTDKERIFSGKGAVLEPNTSGEFTTRIDFKNLDNKLLENDKDSDHPSILVFDYILNLLKESGVQELGFEFILTYEDILGNDYDVIFVGPTFPCQEVTDLSEALDNPHWHREIDEKVAENNNK